MASLALASCALQDRAFILDGQRTTPARALKQTEAGTKVQVAAVPAAADRIPGRALVVLPDADRIRPFVLTAIGQAASSPQAVYYAVHAELISLRADADGLRQSGLFNEVNVVERNDTEDPDFDGYDYLIWFQVGTSGPNHTGRWYGRWQVRRAPDRTAEPAAVDAGVPARDRIASWVRAVQTAAVNLGAPAGDGAAAKAGSHAAGDILSSIVVTPSGHIVTNDHGVKGCREITVRSDGERLPATVLAHDAQNDLALLKVTHSFTAIAKFRDGTPVRQGEAVVAVGFPLGSLLSTEATVTTGTVSALAGLRNDTRFLAFTAPVQAGNSGGPLLDASGHVTGIVSAKLDALRVAAATGDIPQNVNFALKKALIEDFLDANSVNYATAPPGKESSPADIGAAAKRYTLFVECRK
ncbi:MAG: trypsin-like peptidase domain-containing protein [Alphaproteobacteria bacterium]|nr:trypsin-like peptidase domain-containing protein [Alphaproteobacteria bacterium]